MEPLPYYRQIKFYHNIIPFENIGMVYTDPVIAGIPDYQDGAEELGIEITGALVQEQGDLTNEQYADVLLGTYESLLRQNIDAYMLNADLVTSDMELAPLIEPFLEAGIPVFVQGRRELRARGRAAARGLDRQRGRGPVRRRDDRPGRKRRAAGGYPLRIRLLALHEHQPDTAKRIGFRPSFEILLSCETIYSSTAEGGMGA